MTFRPPVTPIFPKNGPITPSFKNLPIRNMDTKDHILNSSGQHYSYNTPSCITIAQHIDTCPVCGRLYDTDKTLYILVIIGLLIFSFILVKHIIKI
jgi:hypothetical protein